MANKHVSHGEVKSIVEGLEISPSKHARNSPIRHGGSRSGASGKESGFHGLPGGALHGHGKKKVKRSR